MLDGYVHPNFSGVANTLIRQIPRDGRGGAGVCVYHRGECVVDIWGGVADKEGNPWHSSTVAPSFSTTKGVVSTLIHILADRGVLSYADPVAKHWEAFGSRGKADITVRQLLCHEAGLYRLSEVAEHPAEMLDWQRLTRAIADAEPVHAPGQQHGYHALTYGWLAGGLVEAVTGQPLQQVLQELLVDPLALDGCYIGLPDSELPRRARLFDGVMRPARERGGWSGEVGGWVSSGLGKLGVDVGEFRAALAPFDEPFDWNDQAVVQAVIPAANGQFTARSLARIYAMIASGGELEGQRLLSDATVQKMGVIQNRGPDKVLFIPMRWRMGYHRAFTVGVRAPHAFGHYGYGGSGAFCDPSRQLSGALTVNSGSGSPTGDTRMPRIVRSAIRAADRLGR